MLGLYKGNLSCRSSNTKFLKFRSGFKEEKDDERKKLILNYDCDFNHDALQNAIATENINETLSLLSEFKNFYSKYKFKPSINNISSINSILAIINQRDSIINELIIACFDALKGLFLSKIDSSILIQANILDILHPYLTDPKIDDIIPSLEVIKYLVKSNEPEITLGYYNISTFKRILQTFNHKQIDKIVQTILICFFKAIERNKNSEKIDTNFYIQEINELFDSTFYVLNKEIRAFSIHDKNHKCYILSLYLDLFYKLIQNNEGFCPDLNSNLMGNSISPILLFNTILHECEYVKPVSLTIEILMEVIHNHFEYLDLNSVKRIQYFLISSPSNIQSLAMKFFFTLIQKITSENNLIDPDQLKSLKGLIYELDLYSNLIELFKTNNLFFNSIDYAIQSLDILHDFLADNKLLQSYDQEMVENLCLLINGSLSPETLNSVINILFKLLDFLTATNIEHRDIFVQEIINNLDQETIDLVLQSKKVELVHKAQIFFSQIHDLDSSSSNS